MKKKIIKISMVLYDAVAVTLAYSLALLIRYYVDRQFVAGADYYIQYMFKMIPIHCICSVIVLYFFKVYDIVWEYAGIRDIVNLFVACISTSILYVFISCVVFVRMPNGYYFIGAIITIMLVGMSRFAYKVYLEERNQHISKENNKGRTLVVGMGPVAKFVTNQVESGNGLKVVCAIDPKLANGINYINGIPVYSKLDNLEKIILKKKVKHVIIVDHNITKEQINSIETICSKYELKLDNYVDYFDNIYDEISQISLETKKENSRIIPFSPPDISDLEINEVKKAMKSGWITTGPRTKELEKRISEMCHTPKVVCLNSATAAEELNFRICGIGEGDEVIVPAYTYTATASAAIHCGAKVIFVDSQKDSCEMDYGLVEKAITEKTKAIVAVDLGGIIADYDKLFEVVNNKKDLFKPKQGNDLGARIQQSINRVLVFADCAHALGASRNGKMAGEIADFTDFSFHAVKNFTTAEGGASTWKSIQGIDDEEIYHQFQLYSLHGQSKDALAKTKIGAWEYDVVGPWYKCNMTDIMAAIGLRQLDRYPSLLERRKEIIKKYDAMCDELGVKHLVHYTNSYSSSGHLYLTRIPNINDKQRRDIINRLAEVGVTTNVHYKPLPMMSAYKNLGWNINDFPNAYNYYENLITLPLHTKLSDEDVDYVITNYKQVVKGYL